MDQMIVPWLSLGIACLALVVSFANYWSANLKTGQVLMTKPTIFFFGHDQARQRKSPKIFMRSLLFATAQSGRVLENLYLVVKSPTQSESFHFWGHTRGAPNTLTRGSGLFVSKAGTSEDHHFNPDPEPEKVFSFDSGDYEITVLCRQFGDSTDRILGRFTLNVDIADKASIARGDGVLWTLNPETQNYRSEIYPRGGSKIARYESVST